MDASHASKYLGTACNQSGLVHETKALQRDTSNFSAALCFTHCDALLLLQESAFGVSILFSNVYEESINSLQTTSASKRMYAMRACAKIA